MVLVDLRLKPAPVLSYCKKINHPIPRQQPSQRANNSAADTLEDGGCCYYSFWHLRFHSILREIPIGIAPMAIMIKLLVLSAGIGCTLKAPTAMKESPKILRKISI